MDNQTEDSKTSFSPNEKKLSKVSAKHVDEKVRSDQNNMDIRVKKRRAILFISIF